MRASVSIALLCLAGASAAAPASETPAQFVHRLFELYRPGGQLWASPPVPGFQKRVYAEFYDPVFVRLMDDNGTLADTKSAGEDLDADPVCQCQDYGATYAYVSGSAKGAFFHAKVTDNASDTTPWTLVLQMTPHGWRIYDVIDTTGDLRVWLARDNACLRAAKTAAAAKRCLR